MTKPDVKNDGSKNINKRILAMFCMVFCSFVAFAQTPNLEKEKLKEGLLELKFKDSWKYQPGDNLTWANPDFDDSNWLNLDPIGLKAYNMPDSLWEGYGWWRLTFKADSQLIKEIERLYFYTWGAAEVYLDGERVQSYGHFSTDSKLEKAYTPNYDGDRPISIKPRKEHTIAVRFSNHSAKNNFKIFRYFSENLGFNIGFSNHVRAKYSDRRFANSFATLAVIGVVLSILLLLHILLYFKFRKDKANLVITLITFLLLCAAICAHVLLFFNLNGFTNPIISSVLNSTAFGLAYGLLPYSLSLIFRTKKFYWTRHLVWIALLRTSNYFIKVFNFIIFDAVIIFWVIILMVLIMRIAIKEKNKGVHYVTFGAIGTSIFLLINRIINTGIFTLSTSLYYLDLILLYICFPLGIYIYIANQFGLLFQSLENEVKDRTYDLNQTVENLEKTQGFLTKKNAENELLLKEVHHRVKNNLEVVSSLLELQSEKTKDPEIQNAMRASQNRVLSMGILHQKLYQSEHLAFIEMKNYFIHLTENILDSYSAVDRVEVEFDMKNIELDIDTAVPIGLIVNELITNALKYAFPGGQMGKIRLSLKDLGEKMLQLTIADNGIGKSSASNSMGTGFGTQLVHLLTKQLEGTLTQEINKGTVISIQFKGQIMI